MTTRRLKRRPEGLKTRSCTGPTAGQHRPTSPIALFQAVQSPKTARSALGYSQVGLALALSRLAGTTISAEMIQHWEASRRRVPGTMRRCYGQLIANELYHELGRIVGVTLSIHSPWRVHIWRECARCGKWFEVRSVRRKFCGCGR